jgi:hypothetical protein
VDADLSTVRRWRIKLQCLGWLLLMGIVLLSLASCRGQANESSSFSLTPTPIGEESGVTLVMPTATPATFAQPGDLPLTEVTVSPLDAPIEVQTPLQIQLLKQDEFEITLMSGATVKIYLLEVVVNLSDNSTQHCLITGREGGQEENMAITCWPIAGRG